MLFVVFSHLLLLGVIEASQTSCTSSNCTSVKTMHMSLKEFVKKSPYYLLKTSSSMDLAINVSTIDSVCFGLSNTCDGSGPAVVHATTTLTCGSTVITTGEMTEMEVGNFYVNTTTIEYQDFILAQPCPGTYVIYLCVMSKDGSVIDTVIIVSRKRSVDEDCLKKAECLALKTFPNLTFTTLPNTVKNPCSCT